MIQIFLGGADYQVRDIGDPPPFKGDYCLGPHCYIGRSLHGTTGVLVTGWVAASVLFFKCYVT